MRKCFSAAGLLGFAAIAILVGLHAQNPNTAAFPSAVATDSNLFVATNLGTTTLNGNITNSQTTVVVTSASALGVAPIIMAIGTELIHCTSLSTNTYSGCTRGAESTTAASASSGATVTNVITAWHHNQIAAEVKAIETELTTVGCGIVGASSALSASGTCVTISNAGTTGTTQYTLTKLTGAPSTAVIAATTDITNIIGITDSGAGTSGSAVIKESGQESCVFDSSTVAGDYVGISSTTAGDCHDIGALGNYQGQVIGRVLSTNGSGGTYTVDLSLKITMSGAGTIQYGAIASLPSSSTVAGNEYICTDSPYHFVWTGSAWQPYVFGYKVTQPVLANFTQTEVSISTFDTTHGGILWSVTSGGGSANTQQVLSFGNGGLVGSGAYYVDAAFTVDISGGNGGLGVGITPATPSGSSAIAFADYGSVGSGYQVSTVTCTALSNCAGSNVVAWIGVNELASPLIWTRIYDDGSATRYYYYSTNGYMWRLITSTSRTSVVSSPGSAVFIVTNYNASLVIHLLHFSVHS
jgi:hypothetical protein